MEAARSNNYLAVELICKYSKTVNNPFTSDTTNILNWKNVRNETPLFIAVEEGHLEIVDLLMSNGASATEPCIRGWTAIHEACVQQNVRILTHLLMAGDNLDIPDHHGVTPLFSAVMCG